MTNFNKAPVTPLDYEGPLHISTRGKKLLAGAAIAASLLGVAKGADMIAEHYKNPIEVSTTTDTYTVQPGDTLWDIADDMYPNVSPIDAIHHVSMMDENRPIVSDGLQPGEQLTLPEDMSNR